MPQLSANTGVVTQITLVEPAPGDQDKVLSLMKDRAKLMATQPGYVSISLHKSKDGNRVVNYVQWASADQLQAAHRSPEFQKRWPELSRLSEQAVPNLYDIVFSEEK